MECRTFSHIDSSGQKQYRTKISYDTLDRAIEQAKKDNLRPQQVIKLVAYKCKNCHKYHLGRNGNPITDKYIKRLKNDGYQAPKTYILEKTYDEDLWKNHGVKREVMVRRVIQQ